MQQHGPNIFMTIAIRLKTERERLALSQPQLGDIVGVGKTTVINWEKGASAPDAVQLAALAAAGGDVLYILTGQSGVGASALDVLPPKERALIDNYRHAPPAGQKIIEGTALLAAKPKDVKGRKAA